VGYSLVATPWLVRPARQDSKKSNPPLGVLPGLEPQTSSVE